MLVRRLILVALLVCGCTAGPSWAREAAAVARPNLLLVHVDDLGWQDVSLPLGPETTHFNTRYRTPHLVRLAARGVRFTDAYAAAPVCTPSRTSLLTGQSPGQTRITYWTLHRDRDTSARHPTLQPPAWRLNGLSDTDITLPRLLQQAGYRTIHVGKAHFGAHDTPGADPRHLGFDVNIAGHASGGPASYYGRHDFSVAGRRGEPDGPSSVWDIPGLEAEHGMDVYLTEVLADRACAAVSEAVQEGRPFFLNFAPYAVHAPIMANERYLENYEGLNPREAAYATMIETVDAALGQLLATCDELGVAGETVVVFTSDNGGLSAHARGGEPHTHNAPLRSGKGSAYEGGVRVPLVIVWPGVTTPATVSRAPVITYDLFPTFLAMAGAEIPPEHLPRVEGRDLSPILRGKVAAAAGLMERPLHWHQPHQWGVRGPGIHPFTSMRQGSWKLVYFHATRRLELYDLGTDLGEEHDLAEDDPARVQAMAATLQAWLDRWDAQMSIDRTTGHAIPGPANRGDESRKRLP